MGNKSDEGLESIAEDEEHGEEEASEITGPITDDATTEDETADHTQASDEEGFIQNMNLVYCGDYYRILLELSEAEQEAVSESLALPSGPKKVECAEDEEFLNALDKMVSENIQERIREPVKTGYVDISVPTILKPSKKTYDQLQVSSFSIFSRHYFQVLCCRREVKPKETQWVLF